MRRAFVRYALFPVALLSIVGPALALDHVLENVTIKGGADGSELAIPRMEITETNLTRAEINKLLSLDASADEANALAGRLQAKRISIPQMTLIARGDDTGTIVISNQLVVNIDKGRFERISIDGIEGKFMIKEAGAGSLSSGPIVMQDGDFSKMLDAARNGDMLDGVAKLGAFSWAGLQMNFPDKDTPRTAVGGNLYKIGLASLKGSTTYAGEVPLKSVGALEGMTFVAPLASEAGRALASFGYEKLDVGMTFEGVYDPAKRAYSLNDYTISGVSAGALKFTGAFGGLESKALVGEGDERLNALSRGDVSALTLNYVDRGLFGKALGFYASSVGKDVESVRSEWAMLVTGLLPMLMGGDPASLKIAESLGAFVRDPKSLNVSLKAKGAPVRFLDAPTLADPSAFLAKVDVAVTANK
jgi:hypothetical protein